MIAHYVYNTSRRIAVHIVNIPQTVMVISDSAAVLLVLALGVWNWVLDDGFCGPESAWSIRDRDLTTGFSGSSFVGGFSAWSFVDGFSSSRTVAFSGSDGVGGLSGSDFGIGGSDFASGTWGSESAAGVWGSVPISRIWGSESTDGIWGSKPDSEILGIGLASGALRSCITSDGTCTQKVDLFSTKVVLNLKKKMKCHLFSTSATPPLPPETQLL